LGPGNAVEDCNWMTVVVSTVFCGAADVEKIEDEGDALELVELLVVDVAAFPIVVKADGFATTSQ
jgi:hypothetical protein